MCAFPEDSLDYSYSVYGLFRHVLTALLLPNRLPLSSLTQFSGQLPLASLPMNTQIHALIGEVTLEERVHLLANLLAFSAVRYAKLPSPSLKSLLLLYTDILNNIPPNALKATTEAPLSSSWRKVMMKITLQARWLACNPTLTSTWQKPLSQEHTRRVADVLERVHTFSGIADASFEVVESVEAVSFSVTLKDDHSDFSGSCNRARF